MTHTITQTLPGYDAARSGPALYRVPDPGYLRIGGADQAAYIQRQTTNDVTHLAPDHPLLTVLTSPTARILDVWWLVREPDAIGVITLPGRGTATAHALQRRIFFMDKVTVEDTSAAFARFDLFGPGAEDMARTVPDLPVSLSVPAGPVGMGVLLLVPAPQADALAQALTAAGAAPVSDAAYHVLRIEGGIPAAGHELTEDFTPLETNLDSAVSSSKGCYTGQEIIARQITYDKITRRLAGVRLDAPVAPGAAIQVDGRSAGVITSAVESPVFGPVALAVIKRPHHAPGTAVTVTAGDGTISGMVCALPF